MGRLWLLQVSQLSICFLLSQLAIQQAHANSERDALLAFKEAVEDPSSVLESWDTSLKNPCTWFHVLCNLNDNVIHVDLGDAALKGILVPQLGKLIHLQYMELFNNDLSGVIPLEFGDLTKLISLDLYGNHLRGHIPTTVGNLSHLKYLRLNDNNLTGSIPFSLTKVPLQVLDLSNNNLKGPIPTNGSFKSLTYKCFRGNPHLCNATCTCKLPPRK